MLFDEKKLPYHLMLHKFVTCGGQAAFFEAFNWALTAGGRVPIEHGLEYSDLPEGISRWKRLRGRILKITIFLLRYWRVSRCLVNAVGEDGEPEEHP